MLIVLKPYRGGGIGNYLFHLCHAVMYAQLKRATLLVPTPLSFRSMNEGAVALDCSESTVSHGDEIEVLGSFIHGNEATRLFSFPYRYHCMQDHVKPLFDPGFAHEEVGDDTLVIHVRSGDIFQEGGSNPKYGQPPVSWYRHLIEAHAHGEIRIVTQGRFAQGHANPVVERLKAEYPDIVVQAEGTEWDFHTLRHCARLALSGGTFAVTAAMLNTNLRCLHVPLYDRPSDPNFSDVFPPGHEYGFDLRCYEIRGYENLRVWKNRPDQVATMLEHPIGNIVPVES